MAEVETKTDVKDIETKEQEKETEGTKTKEERPEVDVEAVKEQAVKDYMKSLGIEDDKNSKASQQKLRKMKKRIKQT